MNRTLLTAFWRQRLTSPVRLALLAMLGGVPVLTVAFLRGADLALLGSGQGLILVLGAGMIGQDVSSGVLQLIFARPVRRPDYVLSRWLAVALAATAVSLVQIALACAAMAARGAPAAGEDILAFAGTRALECFGLAAVLALFSSLLGGFGDLALYLLAGLGAGLVQIVGQFTHQTWLDRFAGEVAASLTPRVDLAQLAAASPMPWYPIVAYASTVTLCLALAIAMVNRRELSYASSG